MRGTLKREGQGYRVGLGDRTLVVRESRGLNYLATLIARPGDEIHVLGLASSGEALHQAGEDIEHLVSPRAAAINPPYCGIARSSSRDITPELDLASQPFQQRDPLRVVS